MINDGAVRGLLLIHNLHPVSLETRLLEALDKIRPYMESHGGNVELLSLDNDVAKLRLQGHCKSCPSSAVTMELAIRSAIEEACPDLMGFEVEGLAPIPGSAPIHAPNGAPAWTEVPEAVGLAETEMIPVQPGEVPLVSACGPARYTPIGIIAPLATCPFISVRFAMGFFRAAWVIAMTFSAPALRLIGRPFTLIRFHCSPRMES